MLLQQHKHYLFLIILALYAGAALLQQQMLFNWDVSWLLHVSDRLLAGGSYTRDFFELNPPLILYLYAPAALLNKLFSLPAYVGLQIYVFILATLSLYLCNASVQKILQDNLVKQLFLVTTTCLFLILPLYDFGQREHLVVIFTLPYFLLLSLRLEHKPVNTRFAVLIGLFASLGLAIKPFFLIAPFLIEIFYMVQSRRLFNCIRAETMTIALFLMVYLAFIAIFHFDYLSVILPFASNYYSGIAFPWAMIFSNPLVLFCVPPIALHFILYKINPYKPLCSILLLAMLGFLFSYLIQHTPWHDHILPAYSLAVLLNVLFFGILLEQQKLSLLTSCFLLALSAWLTVFLSTVAHDIWTTLLFYPAQFYGYFAILLALLIYAADDHKSLLKVISSTLVIIGIVFAFSSMTKATSWYPYRFDLTLLLMILLFGLLVPGKNASKMQSTFFLVFGSLALALPAYNSVNLYQSVMVMKKKSAPLIQFLQAHADHQSVYFFCSTILCEYPFIDYANALPAARIGDMMWVVLLEKNMGLTAAKRASETNYMENMIAEDIMKYKPAYIFVDISPKKLYLKNPSFNYIEFFSQNPQFQVAWKPYANFATIDIPGSFQFQVYKRI